MVWICDSIHNPENNSVVETNSTCCQLRTLVHKQKFNWATYNRPDPTEEVDEICFLYLQLAFINKYYSAQLQTLFSVKVRNGVWDVISSWLHAKIYNTWVPEIYNTLINGITATCMRRNMLFCFQGIWPRNLTSQCRYSIKGCIFPPRIWQNGTARVDLMTAAEGKQMRGGRVGSTCRR